METSQGGRISILAYTRADDEALHLAWSRDGLLWEALNEGQPILRLPQPGDALREPFIQRGADGYYRLLTPNPRKTDSLLFARSKDLLHWESWGELPVMASVTGTRGIWTPRFSLDASRTRYLLTWTAATPDRPHTAIWCASTTDFRTLGRVRPLFDPGYAVSDANLLARAGLLYLLYKDSQNGDRRAIGVATADPAVGAFTPQARVATERNVASPSVFAVENRWLLVYDGFPSNEWGALRSDDLQTWEPAGAIRVPDGARSGSVFSITHPEWERVVKRSPSQPAYRKDTAF